MTHRCWGPPWFTPADHRGFILVSSVSKDQTRFLSLGVIIWGRAILCGGPPWALGLGGGGLSNIPGSENHKCPQTSSSVPWGQDGPS